jgi:hypothetical protein
MTYRDMTFCTGDGCTKFGPGCGRSLTDSVKEAAARWWGGEGAPISVMADPKELPCYCAAEPENRTEEVIVS